VGKKCANDGSVLRGTIFYNAKLKLEQIIILMVEW
jgi:hypothetical protein